MPSAQPGRDARIDGNAEHFHDEDVTLRTSVPMPTALRLDRCVLTVLAGDRVGRTIPVRGEDLIIGRSEGANLHFPEPSVSRHHACISRVAGQVLLEDLGSVNGTFVRGERVTAPVVLRDGDRIRVGAVLLKVSFEDALEERVALELYETAVRDPLTGIHNRRHLDERLDAEHSFARRHGLPLSALLLDVDHFKRINDTWGHQVGDKVLQIVAETVRRLVRPEDIVARYGGDEIVILARATTAAGAASLGERIRSGIAKAPLPIPGRVTVSVGVATSLHGSNDTPAALVEAADRALYLAKERGRDQLASAP